MSRIGNIFKKVVNQCRFKQNMIGVMVIYQDGEGGHHVPELISANLSCNTDKSCCLLNVRSGYQLNEFIFFMILHNVCFF